MMAVLCHKLRAAIVARTAARASHFIRLPVSS